jgi:hypothetical protein
MINTLINAGVDEELVFNFINQPLVIEYIRNIQNMSGIYGKITGVAPKNKSFIKSNAIALVFEQLQKRNKGIEIVMSSAVENANRIAFDNIMNNLKSSTPIAIPLDKNETEFFKTTVGKLKKDINNDKVKFDNVYKIYNIEDGQVTSEVLFQKSSSPVSESIYYHVANLVNNRYGQEEYSLGDVKALFENQDNSSPQALSLFLHYIQLEKALRGHESSQMLFSPDTSNVKTVNQARSTQKAIDELIESETIDPELFNKFNEKAIISSFRVTDLIIDTISTLLPLRLNETISNAIDDYHTTMTSKFPGKDGKELYSTIFNDAVINYIYQNNMSNLLDENGQVIDYPNSYKGIDVEQSTSSDKAVTIKGKKIIINPEIIDNEFTKGYYLDTIGKNNDPESYMSQGYYAFASDKDPFRRRIKEALPLSFKSNYVNFIIQRELLRLTTPIEKLENDVMYLSLYEKLGDKAYEAYLAKRALMNSFNPNYILGKAEFTYTEDVLEAMSMVDPNTKYQIPLLGVLSEQSQIQTEDKILQLNDTLDESSAQAYYRDIVVLGDITIRKSDDPDVNKFITDIFKNFSLYMFYQHGVGYSRLGFSKALDASSFTLLMKDAAATFLQNIDSNETILPQIYLEIKNVDNFRNYNAYDNRYDTVSEEVVNLNIEDDDDITDAFLKAAFGDDVSEDSPVANVITRLQETETTNPYRAKDIDMFKQSTAFIGFETTANDPILESKSSTKIYREAFAELANKGKYTPTDIIALSGSGNFGRKGQLGIVDLTPFIDQDFKTKYAPEIDRAIEDGVRTFLLGTYNDPRNKQDYNIQKYLESKGYVAQTVQSGSYKHYRFTLGEQSTQPSTSVTLKAVASIPQNLVSGIEAFGTKQEANAEAKKLLGNSPHSIDMVEAGLRTRTTRSVGEMDKYNVKVGDIIKQFGKSADGTTKNILTRVTAIHPKGTPGFLGTWNKEGWTQEGIKAIERYKDGAAAIEFEVIQPSTQPTVQPTGEPVSNTNKPKGEEVVPGIYVNQAALTKEEQLELFNYLKPYLEEQAAKTNKGSQASKMIGLGLRWDYKSNNLGKDTLIIPDVINPGNRNKYGYYNVSINYQPLGQITPRFRELMQKATGVDMTDYDGAIINLYEKDTFISAHNDVDESKSAIKYPVIGINLGGKGNFSIERIPGAGQLNLEAGTAYVFGVDGVNREVWHRTFPTPQDSFLPELTTKIDGKTYPAGSYRVTITMRRVKSIRPGMPTAPSIVSTQPADTRDLTSISETTESDLSNNLNQPEGLPAIRRSSPNCG